MNKFLGALLVGEDEEGNDLGDSGLSVGSSGSLNDVEVPLRSPKTPTPAILLS